MAFGARSGTLLLSIRALDSIRTLGAGKNEVGSGAIRPARAWSAADTLYGRGSMNFDFPAAVPEIPVRDINKATAYYQRNLGFTLDWGNAEGGIVGMSRGHCRLFLTNAAFREGYGNTGPVLSWFNL